MTTLKSELFELTHEQVSIQLTVVKSIQNELMGEQKSTRAGWGVNPSAGHVNIVEDEKENLENWCGHRDALPREKFKFDAKSPNRQSKYWAREHRDGLLKTLEGHLENTMRERAEIRGRLPVVG